MRVLLKDASAATIPNMSKGNCIPTREHRLCSAVWRSERRDLRQFFCLSAASCNYYIYICLSIMPSKRIKCISFIICICFLYFLSKLTPLYDHEAGLGLCLSMNCQDTSQTKGTSLESSSLFWKHIFHNSLDLRQTFWPGPSYLHSIVCPQVNCEQQAEQTHEETLLKSRCSREQAGTSSFEVCCTERLRSNEQPVFLNKLQSLSCMLIQVITQHERSAYYVTCMCVFLF